MSKTKKLYGDSCVSVVGTERRGIPVMAACCLVLLAGCGPQLPATAPVHGKITFGGKPVASGKIAFRPTAGRSSLGTIASDGSYTLSTFSPGDGAILGKHHVTIEATKVTGPSAPKSLDEERRGGADLSTLPQVIWIVPQLYSRTETSPLEANVQPGSNTIDFDLK
jgi:hypothetical protein